MRLIISCLGGEDKSAQPSEIQLAGFHQNFFFFFFKTFYFFI